MLDLAATAANTHSQNNTLIQYNSHDILYPLTALAGSPHVCPLAPETRSQPEHTHRAHKRSNMCNRLRGRGAHPTIDSAAGDGLFVRVMARRQQMTDSEVPRVLLPEGTCARPLSQRPTTLHRRRSQIKNAALLTATLRHGITSPSCCCQRQLTLLPSHGSRAREPSSNSSW